MTIFGVTNFLELLKSNTSLLEYLELKLIGFGAELFCSSSILNNGNLLADG